MAEESKHVLIRSPRTTLGRTSPRRHMWGLKSNSIVEYQMLEAEGQSHVPPSGFPKLYNSCSVLGCDAQLVSQSWPLLISTTSHSQRMSTSYERNCWASAETVFGLVSVPASNRAPATLAVFPAIASIILDSTKQAERKMSHNW